MIKAPTHSSLLTQQLLISLNAPNGVAGTETWTTTIYLQGIYPHATLYWNGALSVIVNEGTQNYGVKNLIGGGDNWLNAANIYIAYKDCTSTPKVWVSTTAKTLNTTVIGSFSTLAADVTTSPIQVFIPICVWTSNFTYGIAVNIEIETAANSATYSYSIGDFLNGSTTYTDSGMTYNSPSTTSGSGGAAAFYGWMLNTGYQYVAAWTTSTSNMYACTMETFYANGTKNTTVSTQSGVICSGLKGTVSFYEDVNGALWV